MTSAPYCRNSRQFQTSVFLPHVRVSLFLHVWEKPQQKDPAQEMPANKPPQDAGRGDGTGSAGAYITALLEKLVCDMSHTNVCHPPLTQLQLPHSSHVSSWPCLGQGTCGPPLKTLSHYYSTSVSWDTRKFGPLVCKLMCLWTNVQTSAQDLLPVLSESNASPREGYRFTGASLSQRNGGQCCVVGLQVRGEIEKR